MSICEKYQLDEKGIPQNKYPCEKSNQVSVSDLYSISNCIDTLSGQSSNSASPTDIYRLDMKRPPYNPPGQNFLYDGDYVGRIFMKVFVTELCMPGGVPYPQNLSSRGRLSITTSDELLYEYMLYLSKIKNFTVMGICPYFVKVLGGNLRVDYKDIEAFLTSVKMEEKGIQMINDDKKRNLERNMNFIIYEAAGRPSITDSSMQIQPNIKLPEIFVKNYAKYGYFMTEGTPNTQTLDSLVEAGNIDHLNIIIFQLIVACRTMNLARIAHNDLHIGNVMIETRNLEHVIITDSQQFPLRSPVITHIYDFDRGYLEEYKNSLLEKDPIRNASQSNNVLEKRDLVKVLYYIFMNMNPAVPAQDRARRHIAEILINNIPPGTAKLTLLENFYRSRGSFLQTTGVDAKGNLVRVGSNSDAQFGLFDRSYEEMLRVSYDEIEPIYKTSINLCTTHVPTYFVRQQVFDTKGNIMSNNLEELKESYIKQRCLQNKDNTIARLTQSVTDRDNTIAILRDRVTDLENRMEM